MSVLPRVAHPYKSTLKPLTKGFSRWCLDFPGILDRVEIADSPSLGVANVTVEAFVNSFNFVGPDQDIFSDWTFGDPANQAYLLSYGVAPNAFRFSVNTGISNHLSSGITPVDGRTYYVAGSYDGATVRVYVNRYLRNTAIDVGALINSVNVKVVGDRPAGLGTYQWEGWIDEIRVYNRGLSDGGVAIGEIAGGEIGYNMMNYHNPIRAGLVCWLRFEEGQGLIANDLSGNGNNGNLLPMVSPPVWTGRRKWELRAESRRTI